VSFVGALEGEFDGLIDKFFTSPDEGFSLGALLNSMIGLQEMLSFGSDKTLGVLLGKEPISSKGLTEGSKLGTLIGNELGVADNDDAWQLGSQVARQFSLTFVFLQRFEVLFAATHLQFFPFLPLYENDELSTQSVVGIIDGDIEGSLVGYRLGSLGTKMV